MLPGWKGAPVVRRPFPPLQALPRQGPTRMEPYAEVKLGSRFLTNVVTIVQYVTVTPCVRAAGMGSAGEG